MPADTSSIRASPAPWRRELLLLLELVVPPVAKKMLPVDVNFCTAPGHAQILQTKSNAIHLVEYTIFKSTIHYLKLGQIYQKETIQTEHNEHNVEKSKI